MTARLGSARGSCHGVVLEPTTRGPVSCGAVLLASNDDCGAEKSRPPTWSEVLNAAAHDDRYKLKVEHSGALPQLQEPKRGR